MSNAELSGLPAGNWKLMPAPRVRPVERERAPGLARVMLAIVRLAEKTREDYKVFATLARLERTFPAHAIFVSQVLKAGHIFGPRRTQNSATSGSVARCWSHGWSCPKPQRPIPTSRRLSPFPLRTRIAPRD
jgi:hypothetical protein